MAGYATPAWTNNSQPAVSAANLLALGQAVELAQHPYGVCSTTSAIAAKAVTIDFSGTLSLFTGLTVRVKFTYGNTASSPTLNVNSTGAKSITAVGAVGNTYWSAGQIVEFTYDGSKWVINGASSGNAPVVLTGSYTGTGTYGANNPTSITLSGTPVFVVVYYAGQNSAGLNPSGDSGWGNSFAWVPGATQPYVNGTFIYATLTGSTLSWYSTGGSAYYQLNHSGYTYSYVALCI